MAPKEGFTLIELMVAILIVSILAAVVVPPMQGQIDKAKWSEANATAGSIRRSVRIYASETNIAAAQSLAGTDLSNPDTQNKLGFTAIDMEGTYFTAGDYTISSVDTSAVCAVTVVGSKAKAPSGSYQLTADGDWVKQN